MATGVTEIRPGLWRIRLPLHFELNHINVYLARLPDGYLLVDCGIGAEECFAALEHSLQEIGAPWRQIRVVLLTHCHPDHVGLAPRILELSHARAMMHAVEISHLVTIAQWVEHPEMLDSRLHEWGVPADRVPIITHAFAGMRKSFTKLEHMEPLRGGEVLHTSLGPCETVWTPGHSPGHLCLYASRDRLLLSGDHVLPKITPNIAWMPEEDPLEDYLHSLALAGRLDVDLVLPSHGEPFADLPARIRETAAHHESRCERILHLVTSHARSAHEIAVKLWGDSLSPFQQRFALFEVMAHLAYMANRRQVEEAARNGVGYWSRI